MRSKFALTRVESVAGMFGCSVAFDVPKFRRNYSWERGAVEQLWEDLAATFDSMRTSSGPPRDAQYLLGPMVLVSDAKTGGLSVVDGQQRLATLTLLFCAARDIMIEDAEAAGKPARADPLIESLIENTHIDGRRVGWKLALNGADESLLRDIQLRKDCRPTQLARLQKLKPETTSAALLKSAYVLLHERMSDATASCFGDHIKEYGDARRAGGDRLRQLRMENANVLLSFIRCIRDYNFVLALQVPDYRSAFQALESFKGSQGS